MFEVFLSSMSGKRAAYQSSHPVALSSLSPTATQKMAGMQLWFSPASRTVLWIPRSPVYSLKIKQSRGNHGFYRPKKKASCQISIQFWERI